MVKKYPTTCPYSMKQLCFSKDIADNARIKVFNVKVIECAIADFAVTAEESRDFMTWFKLYMVLFPDIRAKLRQQVG